MLQEALAKIDGSLGWTVTLCSGANMFVGYLPPALSALLFNDEKVCLGGSGAVTGTAGIVNEGYVVNGYWKYATGTPHNTAFTANCVIYRNGAPVLRADGSADIRSFLFLREEVDIHNEWKAMGLKATASQSFSVRNLIVNIDRCFIISSATATLPQAVYQYPFIQFAEATIAANTLGMAQHFLQECSIIFHQIIKNQPAGNDRLVSLLQKANEDISTIRTKFYDSVNTSWSDHQYNKQPDPILLLQVSEQSRLLAFGCRQTVMNLYPFCGMKAANDGTVLNRIWRDIFTASQHSLLL